MAPPNRSQIEASPKHAFDWNNVDLPRGRPFARRNSPPPSRMLMGVEDAGRTSRDTTHSNSKSGSRRGRGRVAVDELDGVGSFSLAPGFGNGRSGLVARERFSAARVPL